MRASHVAGFILIAVSIGMASAAPQSPAASGERRNPAGLEPVGVSASTPHLELRATPSHLQARPGAVISVALDITPRARMHVYAPGGKYRPVVLHVDAQPSILVHDVAYPTPEDYFFQPLKEYAQVYSKPFRLAVNITVAEAAAHKPRLTIQARLEYQACDDQFCYLPTSVPLQWTVKIKR